MYVDKLSLTDPFSLEGQGASGRTPPARYRPKFLFIFIFFPENLAQGWRSPFE